MAFLIDRDELEIGAQQGVLVTPASTDPRGFKKDQDQDHMSDVRQILIHGRFKTTSSVRRWVMVFRVRAIPDTRRQLDGPAIPASQVSAREFQAGYNHILSHPEWYDQV